MFWPVLLLVFLPPILGIARPALRRAGAHGSRGNGLLGRLERSSTRWREAAAIATGIVFLVRGGTTGLVPAAVLAGLIAVGRWHRHRAEMETADVVWEGKDLWPHELFRVADQIYGPAGAPAECPAEGGRPEDGYDFRDGAHGARPTSFVEVFLLSSWLTRLCMRSGRARGSEFLFDRIDRAARLWGLAILRVARGRLRTEGAEKLAGLPGKRIFFFSHVSRTDFAFGFPALDRFLGSDGEIKLRFVVAKDHFVDNPIIHSWTGIGRIILQVGMIPIERRSREAARKNLREAAHRVVDSPIDLAFYPQGTRARAQRDADGRILEVGFYTSGPASRVTDPLGHVKKGAGFLALDVALALAPAGRPLHLVPVGVEGAGRVLSKGRWAMQAGETATYRIGEILTIEPGDLEGLDPNDGEELARRSREITTRLERALAAASRIDERLADLWRTEVGGEMPDSAGLRRVFDHALALPPSARREGLFREFRGIEGEIGDEDVERLARILAPES